MSNWYLVTTNSTHQMYRLVSAESEDKAKEKVGFPWEKSKVAQINWGAMKRLTGCDIPQRKRAEDLASGLLFFRTSGVLVTLYPD